LIALLLAVQTVTWIKVQKPTFDLVGVVLSSFALAGVCVLVALALGAVLGFAFILRSRRQPPRSWNDDCVHLLEGRRV
jgi:hypothetical protein